ncbi:hypothetical protein K7W42_16345 [Deinococcus sp. HMF7604]|uniref:hypothetical protein n=1 Tax=Deinococcus betulae TaxID=2873312 RepID=UPI001CCAF13C|nr:hypothetical protein [Deinococcus betulae]MBZ9752420.1 hypothetical protein [Deinococcus betulae]
MTGPKKGSRGRAPKRNTAQGRGGATRDSSRPARERSAAAGSDRSEQRPDRPQTARSGAAGKSSGTTAGGSGRAGQTRGGPRRSGPGQSRGTPGEGGGSGRTGQQGRAGQIQRRKPLPELKRVQLDAPAPDRVFKDRDGEGLTFPDSNLKRVAAQILTEKRKAWRYRPFSFPLFTDKGNEQAFHFDFYVYDAEDSVIRLILVVPFESREVWDRVGRFKRQYPMYPYELWTPEKLARLSGPRGRLEF